LRIQAVLREKEDKKKHKRGRDLDGAGESEGVIDRIGG